MGIVYPDNQNRLNRVQQLATNISHLQENIKQYIDGVHKQNNRTVPMLERISKRAGFATLDDFLKDALDKLTPEQRKQYDDTKAAFEKKDVLVDVAVKVGTGLLAIGIAVGYGAPLMAQLVSSTLMQLSCVALGRGVILCITGAVDEGLRLIKAGARGVSYVTDTAKISETASKALKYIKLASRSLMVVGVAIDGLLIAWEAIEGGKQRTQLQAAIVELVCRRFSVKHIEQSAWVTQLFASDAKALVEKKDDLDEEIENGETTEEKAKKKIEKKMKNVVDQLQTSMAEVTDKVVWEKLEKEDRNSGHAWTDEDPSLEKVQEWMKDHQGNKD